MTRFCRILSFVLSAAAVVLAGTAAYLYWQPDPAVPRLIVEDTHRSLDVIVGKEYDVEFKVFNPSSQARRVVGTEFS